MEDKKFQANQWVVDPRQQLFLKGYLDPKSETFSNALQSALKAGYSQEYSENIMSLMPEWLSDSIGKAKMVIKAERNLDKALDGLLDDPEKGKKEIQWKASEFALERLKKQDYSQRTELTGKNGTSISLNFDNSFNKNAPTSETKDNSTI